VSVGIAASASGGALERKAHLGRGARLSGTGAVIAGAVVVSLALRVYQLSRPGFLLGVTEYDDGPYFGSAVRLLDGSVPYRDFVLVQPPGITLLMVPAALLAKLTGTAGGMAAGRILTTLASAAGVALGGLLVRHRGVLATLVTCGILAVYPASVAASRTVLVEPWLVLFCLIGAVTVFDGDWLTASRRRLAWAGVAFGFAGAVEGWAIVPALVVLIAVGWSGGMRGRMRRAGIYAGGVAAGFLIPVVPFAAASPSGFYRSLITAQIGPRAHPQRVSIWVRLRNMAGITDIHLPSHAPVALITLAIAGTIIILTIAAWRLTRQPPAALDVFALVTTTAVAVMFLWPDQFHYHFPAFLAPFLAMAIALPAARLTAAIETARPGLTSLTRWAIPGVAAAALIGFTALHVGMEMHLGRYASMSTAASARIERIVPAGACVVTDQVSYLILDNRFVSDVPGCSPMIDGLGTDLALSGGPKPGDGAGNAPAVAAIWRNGFAHAQYLWLTTRAHLRLPWTPALQTYFREHFVQVMKDARGDALYARNSLPGTH
jgi:alpha-1,2-mannosyltransferase